MSNSKSNLLDKVSVSDKILALRLKIHDSSYVNNAVQVIALVLSKRIVEHPKTY